MNEQIRKLAGKALDRAVPYTWTKLDYGQIQDLLACHAELIVRECLTQIDKIRDGCEADGEEQQALGAAWAGLAVARHFGVE